MARSRRALEAVASRARRDALSRDVAGSPPGVRSSRRAALAPMRLLALLAVVFYAGSLPRVVLGHIDPDDPTQEVHRQKDFFDRPAPPPPARDANMIGGLYDQGLTIRGEVTAVCSVIIKPPGWLYVEPGATIKFRPDCGSIEARNWAVVNPGGEGVKPSIIVMPGAKIIARGTPELPIVFMKEPSLDDASSVAAASTRGDWGGIILLGRARVSRGDGFRLPNGHSHDTFGALNFTANLTAVQIVNRTREEIYNATRDFKFQRAETLSHGLDANETHVSEAVPLSQMGACHVPPEPEGDVDPSQPFWPACAHVLGEGYDWGAPESHRHRFAFGGEDDAGSCGELEHVVILNAGGTDAPSAGGPDPSALSLYGCGFGTTVNHVEVAHSGGNGINLRGGAALFSDAAVWDFARDGVVASNGYRGALRRLYVDAPSDARSALRSEGTWRRGDGSDDTPFRTHPIVYSATLTASDGHNPTNPQWNAMNPGAEDPAGIVEATDGTGLTLFNSIVASFSTRPFGIRVAHCSERARVGHEAVLGLPNATGEVYVSNDRVFVSDNVIVAGSGRGLGATLQDVAQFGAKHGGGYPTGVDEILDADGFYSRSATPNNTWSPFELTNGCDVAGGADFGFGDGLFPQFHSGLTPGSWRAPAEPTPGEGYADPRPTRAMLATATTDPVPLRMSRTVATTAKHQAAKEALDVFFNGALDIECDESPLPANAAFCEAWAAGVRCPSYLEEANCPTDGECAWSEEDGCTEKASREAAFAAAAGAIEEILDELAAECGARSDRSSCETLLEEEGSEMCRWIGPGYDPDRPCRPSPASSRRRIRAVRAPTGLNAYVDARLDAEACAVHSDDETACAAAGCAFDRASNDPPPLDLWYCRFLDADAECHAAETACPPELCAATEEGGCVVKPDIVANGTRIDGADSPFDKCELDHTDAACADASMKAFFERKAVCESSQINDQTTCENHADCRWIDDACALDQRRLAEDQCPPLYRSLTPSNDGACVVDPATYLVAAADACDEVPGVETAMGEAANLMFGTTMEAIRDGSYAYYAGPPSWEPRAYPELPPPPPENCETVCQGRDYVEWECLNITGCAWNGTECMSAVGPNPCDSGAPGPDASYTENCELVCEGHGYDESECTAITGCQWDSTSGAAGECWSAVGPNPCDSQSSGRRLLAEDGTGAARRRARALLTSHPEYPEDAAFCPSWAKYRICANHGNGPDHCASAAGCEYSPNTGMCTPVYATSDFNFTQLDNSYQYYDFGSSVCTGTSAASCDSEGCRWVADPYTGYSACELTLDAKKQLLADDSIPDAVAGWILTKDYSNIVSECTGRDQTSCDNLHPLCSFRTEDDGTSRCSTSDSSHLYETWMIISACQSAMSSDMSLLDAAANLGDFMIFDGVAQIAAWGSGEAYFLSTAAFCDAWREAEVCGGTDVRNDQTKCQSSSSAYGCSWGEPYGIGSGDFECLGPEGNFHHGPSIFDRVFAWYQWSILKNVTDCDMYNHDADSCNMHSSDCAYVRNGEMCMMRPTRRVQILEEAGAPAYATSLALYKNTDILYDGAYCGLFSDESSCAAPMCTWHSMGSDSYCGLNYTEDNPRHSYATVHMSAACGEPYASDDNIAIANGHADMNALEAAAPAAEYEALVAAVSFYGIPVGDGQGPEACYASPDDIATGTVISGCRCHSACVSCGFGASPFPDTTEDCVACAPGLELTVVDNTTGTPTGSCVVPEPAAGDGLGPAACFANEGDTVAVSGCNCHSTCASCGYNSMPTEDADCITCQPGYVLESFYPDGTGFCFDNRPPAYAFTSAPVANVPQTVCGDWVPGLGVGEYLGDWPDDGGACDVWDSYERGGAASQLVAGAILRRARALADADVSGVSARADVSFFPSRSVLGSIPAGPFAAAGALALLPGDERLLAYRLTGEELVEVLDGAVGVALAASRRVAYEASDDKPWIRPLGVPAPPPPDCDATCAPLDEYRCEYAAGCAYDDGAGACVSRVAAEPCPPPPDRPDLFPCAAGVRFDVDASRDAGERVSNVEVNPGLASSGGGAWVAVDASATYVVVAPALVADVLSGTALPGYEVFNRTDVALSKTEVMSSDGYWVLTEARALAEHAESVGTLAAPPVAEFAVKSYVAPDGVKHTRETFDDPWGTFEKECVYARPDAPGAPAYPGAFTHDAGSLWVAREAMAARAEEEKPEWFNATFARVAPSATTLRRAYARLQFCDVGGLPKVHVVAQQNACYRVPAWFLGEGNPVVAANESLVRGVVSGASGAATTWDPSQIPTEKAEVNFFRVVVDDAAADADARAAGASVAYYVDASACEDDARAGHFVTGVAGACAAGEDLFLAEIDVPPGGLSSEDRVVKVEWVNAATPACPASAPGDGDPDPGPPLYSYYDAAPATLAPGTAPAVLDALELADADDPRSASKAACYFVGVPAAASEAESHAARFECAPNGRLTKKAWVATNGMYACDEAAAAPSWVVSGATRINGERAYASCVEPSAADLTARVAFPSVEASCGGLGEVMRFAGLDRDAGPFATTRPYWEPIERRREALPWRCDAPTSASINACESERNSTWGLGYDISPFGLAPRKAPPPPPIVGPRVYNFIVTAPAHVHPVIAGVLLDGVPLTADQLTSDYTVWDFTSGPGADYYNTNGHETAGTILFSITSETDIVELTITYGRPKYTPGWRIFEVGQGFGEVFREDVNGGSDELPSPNVVVYTLRTEPPP